MLTELQLILEEQAHQSTPPHDQKVLEVLEDLGHQAHQEENEPRQNEEQLQ